MQFCHTAVTLAFMNLGYNYRSQAKHLPQRVCSRFDSFVMARNKPSKNRDRKTKINLVFDESKRRDFLGGFHKRKVERRKKAQEELKQLLKEEKKRIKQENKESYKKLVVSSRPIPELERLLQAEYEDAEADVTVKVVELAAGALGDTQRWIGENRPSNPEPSTSKRSKTKRAEVKDEELPGMELEEDVDSSDDNNDSDDEAQEGADKTKKDIKRMLKQQATKKIQKSKAFQLKNKMERLKNKKKSMRTKHSNDKVKAAGKNPRKNKAKKVTGRRKR